ncbi:hypothetical protein GPECTOR_12g405 [Gonium pectorale]|uniref:Pheophorbide a oxygenase domain-containing protein n=1 Tax=Gonium pectorale TaxID=33097 RepID=A0A150GNX4_GONPE|nr:hypothetical protein GPECTOR_12g405 [Gonium pectorale]|eukprot:KXZ51442.1 hypothetical protein GPECTOR_12g405 [Gonium pectorale]
MSRPRAGKLGPQSTTYTAPAFMRNRLDGKDFSSLTVVYAVPSRPGRCRLINRNIIKFKNALPATFFRLMPRWAGHLGGHVLLEDDQIFLHLGEEEIARRRAAGMSHSQAGRRGMGERVCYMPSTADTYVVAFNRWLSKYGDGGPFGAADAGFVEAIGARLSRQQLLDRYSQHTEGCASCQKGLKQVEAARAAAAAVTVAAGALAVFCAAVAAAAATAPAAATGAAAAAAAAATAPGGAVAALGVALAQVAAAVAGPHDASGAGHMLRAVVWAAVALAAALAGSRLEELRRRFYEGVYPPPRNLKD